ncbi:hypothetical protein CTM45_08855 [Prevotella intermedia]|uniref:Uncharacterized protein n=1 Tax=Prevotella intermedia TaxID=28131 RepID=A0A2D3LIK0_PREIN|nr:hypothetical protein CTM46_02210 [Prevotella intermedia]PJI23375.1 hypothetical protein CTM45_08855 [Prevotella intermedia]
MWHSLLQEKTTSEFFQLSARARVLCCKNGVVLHKTYLAICPMQISLSMKDENESLKKEHFMSRKLRLTAWMQNY